MSGFCGWRSIWSEGWKEAMRIGWERGWDLCSLEFGADLKSRGGPRRAVRGLGRREMGEPKSCWGLKFMSYYRCGNRRT